VTESFFTVDPAPGGDVFRPTDACRGPWSPDACHAGPPTGLLARAAERLVPDQRLIRLTVDLVRPIPHAGFTVRAEPVRTGRTVSTTSLAIVDLGGATVVTATAMHLADGGGVALPTVLTDPPSFAEARPGRFPLRSAAHGLPMFTSAVEVRYPPGDDSGPGPTRMWMRTLRLLPDEEPSGFQRICPLADCGNGVSRNGEPTEFGFVNTDLTILLHRDPVGEWFAIDALSRWEPTGHGMSDSLLFDEHGPVGRALQSLLVRPALPG
jgi:hypothetical protein